MRSTTIENTDPLLTVEETAQYLNTTERWVRRAIADGELDKTKLNRQVRFRKSVLDAYIKRQTDNPGNK